MPSSISTNGIRVQTGKSIADHVTFEIRTVRISRAPVSGPPVGGADPHTDARGGERENHTGPFSASRTRERRSPSVPTRLPASPRSVSHGLRRPGRGSPIDVVVAVGPRGDASPVPMVTTLPYGSWPSPITAELLATGGTQLGAPRLVGEAVWWTEGISTEGGRQAILRTAGPVAVPGNETGAADGAEDAQDPVTVLPAPYNARSRVHEYGGASWTVVPGTADEATRRPPLVVFVNFEDQRVHALREGEQPLPLTPVGPEVGSAHG